MPAPPPQLRPSTRLRSLGELEATPDRTTAEGIDWRLLDELKRKLKA
jgi:hypothetical protein